MTWIAQATLILSDLEAKQGWPTWMGDHQRILGLLVKQLCSPFAFKTL